MVNQPSVRLYDFQKSIQMELSLWVGVVWLQNIENQFNLLSQFFEREIFSHVDFSHARVENEHRVEIDDTLDKILTLWRDLLVLDPVKFFCIPIKYIFVVLIALHIQSLALLADQLNWIWQLNKELPLAVLELSPQASVFDISLSDGYSHEMCIVLSLLLNVNPACFFGEFLKKIETLLSV